MEKIVKKEIIILIVIMFSSKIIFSQSFSIVEKIENLCATNNVIHYYIDEVPSTKMLTFSIDELKIDRENINVHFFSEVDDIFEIYVNGIHYSTKNINTTLYEENGEFKAKARILRIKFPVENNSFLLRIESNKYGCFETEVRKNFPMLYLKYFNNTWYLTHTNVFRLVSAYFLEDAKD